MITIVDYGLGNIKAFANVYKRLNMPFRVAQGPEELEGASKVILPGVGAFDEAMGKLQASGMRDALNGLVIGKKVPVLGICVGMQMLARSSEEGILPGLGWIDGVVKKFDTARLYHKTKVPHMGWNQVTPREGNPLMTGLSTEASFYFLHSYYFECASADDSIGEADYGGAFSCAVNSGNIFGVQFHPEKSHSNGILLLRNFGNL